MRPSWSFFRGILSPFLCCPGLRARTWIVTLEPCILPTHLCLGRVGIVLFGQFPLSWGFFILPLCQSMVLFSNRRNIWRLDNIWFTFVTDWDEETSFHFHQFWDNGDPFQTKLETKSNLCLTPCLSQKAGYRFRKFWRNAQINFPLKCIFHEGTTNFGSSPKERYASVIPGLPRSGKPGKSGNSGKIGQESHENTSLSFQLFTASDHF